MNKVKEMFNRDSDSTRSETSSTTTPRTGHDSGYEGASSRNVAGQDSSLTGTNSHSSHSHSHGTTGATGREVAHEVGSSHHTGTHGVTGGESHVAAKPSLPGHQHNIQANADLSSATGEKTHDHKHLAAVTKETVVEHETEEVIRQREHDRHIHHVQHHVQPVLDTQHREVQSENNVVPTTHIRESHVNTAEDKNLFKGLAVHHDEQHIAPKERTIIDKGEVVTENLHHHVHHVVQPVIERDTHVHKTIHTVIPVKAVTHEAPIVHQSSEHAPLQMKDFLAQGGDLNSKLTHDQAGVLAEGNCAREVDGPLDQLASKLHLGGSTGAHSHGAKASHEGGGASGQLDRSDRI